MMKKLNSLSNIKLKLFWSNLFANKMWNFINDGDVMVI